MLLISVDLPEPETPVMQVNRPTGISRLTFCRLLPRAPFLQQLLLVARGALGRNRDFLAPGKVLAGQRVGVVHHLVGRTFRHYLAAVHAGPRTDVDDVVGESDRVLVVLDHDHRVAEVA